MILRYNKFQAEPILAASAILALVATSVFGTFAALTFIIFSSILFCTNMRSTFQSIVRFSPLFILPLLAFLSTTWSDAPPRTLRAALQLSVTVGAGIVAFHQLDPRKTIALLLFGFLAIAVFALPYVPAAIASGRPMNAFFDSKNALAFNAVLLFALGIGAALDPLQSRYVRLTAVLSIPLACLLTYLCQSASATTSVILVLITMPCLIALGRLGRSARIVTGALLVLSIGLSFLFLPQIETAIGEFRGGVLNKDATLTGRTYLWQVAAQVTAERPWLGHGYNAFWRLGNLDAEGLWRWGGIANRSGFNFHNAYIEMAVDLGFLGQAILYSSCAMIALLASVRQVQRPSTPIAFFLSLQIVVYIRSYAETGLIAPFSLVTVLWVATAVYAVSANDGAGTPEQAPPLKLRIPHGHVRVARRRVRPAGRASGTGP